jgi:predicted nucleic acid-binding protein
MATILLDTSITSMDGMAAPNSWTSSSSNSLDFVPVTPAIARQASLLRRDWQKKGQTLSYTDLTIAAVALTSQTPLLTDNRKHFPMIELQLLSLPANS